MRLIVTTPLAVPIETDDVVSVRAEDASGAFGILPGHADFLTVLLPSVLSYRDRQGMLHHVAVHGGVLSVEGGADVLVATQEAFAGDDLDVLEDHLLRRAQAARESELQARTEATRLQLAAIRHLQTYLRAGHPEHARQERG